MSPPFQSKKVKTDGEESDLLLIAVACFIFLLPLPDLPLSLCSFVPHSPFIPASSTFISSVLLLSISSLVSLCSLLCFFSNLSLSRPVLFPPLPFLFFPSLYVPSPVTIVDILPSSSVRLIYNNAIKIKKVYQMIFLF